MANEETLIKAETSVMRKSDHTISLKSPRRGATDTAHRALVIIKIST